MITVNAMGDNCPIPVIKTKKAIAALTGPETIEVLVDNEIAVQNVTKMASGSGGKVTSEKLGDAEFKVTIEMEGAPAADEAEAVCVPDARDNTVVVVSSDRMGSGNDELGKVLIKGFIFAVTQLDTLPKTMLFYNGGATLTTEDSDSLEVSEITGSTGSRDHDMWNLSGLLWSERQACSWYSYEYVQHCGDNGKSRKNRQTIINLLTYLDKSRIPEERYRSSGFLILSCMYNEYKNPGVSER